MNRRTIRCLTIGSIAVGLGIAGTVVASAQWSIPGQGTIRITTAAMPVGNTPTAKKQGDSIAVRWVAQEIAPGVKMQKYLVTAHDTQSPARPDLTRIVSAAGSGEETTTFTVAELGTGNWSWGIAAKYQLWSGAEGPRSGPPVPVGGNPPPALLAAAVPAGVPTTKPTTDNPAPSADPAPSTTSPSETATTTAKPKTEPTTSAPEKTVEPAKTESAPSPSAVDPSPAESAP